MVFGGEMTAKFDRYRLVQRLARRIGWLRAWAGSPGMLQKMRREPGLIILAYHQVGDGHRDRVPASLRVGRERFRSEMQWLQERFEMISLERGLERLERGKMNAPAVAITFDDGFGGVFTEAYAVLKEKQIPATVFLNGAFVSGECVSPRIRIESLIHSAGADALNRQSGFTLSADQWRGKIKQGRQADTDWLGRLEEHFGQPDWSGLHLGLEQLAAMDCDLIHYANHTWSHLWLAGLQGDTQRQEAERTDALLKDLPHYRRWLAAPFGEGASVDGYTEKMVREDYGGWLFMLGCGINPPKAVYPGYVVRNAVDETKPPLNQLLGLNRWCGRKGIPMRRL